MNLSNRFSFLGKLSFILWAYVIIVVVASVHRYALGIDHINNFIIFKTSFLNLVNNNDLYIHYPDSYHDLYKYSPLFAFLMAPFALLPDLAGLILWNLINVLTLFFAIKKLQIEEGKKVLISWFVLLELLTSVQNSQSNGLMAGLILFAFVSFENRNLLLAALFISLSFYLKIFGLAAVVLFLLYPGKVKFIGYLIFWNILFFFIPLLVIPLEQLLALYKSWFHLLSNDPSHSLNFSVMTLINSWLNIQISAIYIQSFGLILLLLPFVRYNCYGVQRFRLLLLSSVLIWVIIFNHKAESPTFIIAMLGVALWFSGAKSTKWNLALLLFAFVITSLSPTDLFPRYVRENFLVPYVLKVFPCILIWIKIQQELLFRKHELPGEEGLKIVAHPSPA